ncbi:hypothetical protein MLD38_019508 [Melastoma candidum]|uniref:Uncharacterized protein n=1 Tax=Melastoma candidum TaxID=119954 RepID=A0ACB9QWN4_9MYRT|nr:hypothetical protein MLD38_019508 [Melastoma candidum]
MGNKKPRKGKNNHHSNHRAHSSKSHLPSFRDEDSLPAEPAAEEESSVPKVHLAYVVERRKQQNCYWGKFKWGHAFLSLNRELLKAYSQCENSAEIISVQNSWLSQQNDVEKVPVITGKEGEAAEDDDSDYSEDGLPPLERNVNHLRLEESEEDSEHAPRNPPALTTPTPRAANPTVCSNCISLPCDLTGSRQTFRSFRACKMSTYPILDNRPIDQWKVVELKEELKRRKLTTRGLKEDLVKRLDEALRIEREYAAKQSQQEANNGSMVDFSPGVTHWGGVEASVGSYSAISLGNLFASNDKVDSVRVEVDVNNSLGTLGAPLQVAVPAENIPVPGPSAASAETISVAAVSSEPLATPSDHVQVTVEAQENGNSEVFHGNEDIADLPKDVVLESSAPISQVSEANPDLGYQVRSVPISTDYVSINENNEYKDNIITDNIELELDVVKPETEVEPSSGNVDPDSGDSHPLDVVEPHGDKVAAEDKEDNDAITAGINKNNEHFDVCFSEKLNLDRSSGDDSMEEDVLDSKHVDLKPVSEEVGGGGVKEKPAQVKEESLVDIVGDADIKDINVDKDHTSDLIEKRKIYGIETDMPSKRQRKWNSDGLQVSEPKVIITIPTTTPKYEPQAPSLKQSWSRSNSASSDDALKERIVPPSQHPATNSLRIDQFLRPFTLKAVQELLGKTGTVTSFWMDNIKTHCYVTYSSVEEAVETRNAVYNLQWPPYGGRLLVAEFVDPQEVKEKVDGPPTPAPAPVSPAPKPGLPVSSGPISAAKGVPQPGQLAPRQQQLAPPPPLLQPLPPQDRDMLHLPPPPPTLTEKADATIVTLDVLFKKTKATPRIYYLPLSEEQVAAKLASRGRSTRQ